MSTVIREDDLTAGMNRKLRRHLDQIVETTPGLRLVNPATGELRHNAVHHLDVPSHSDPDRTWELRVSWSRRQVKAWHHGEACPAFVARGRCWHLYGAAHFIADRWHDGLIPDPGPRRPSSPVGDGQPIPAEALAGFYD